MIFETSRGRSVLLCHSWQFKLCFVWGGELVSTLTSSILQMGLIWHLALTTGSSSLLSLASLAGFLPIALFGILAGAVVDRLPLKRVLIGTDLFIAAVGAALAIASLAGSLPAWLILIALFLRAVGTSFYTPASQSLTPHLGTEGHGLSPRTLAACDDTVMIPMSHGVDSLNVAAASAVAFWETRPRS